MFLYYFEAWLFNLIANNNLLTQKMKTTPKLLASLLRPLTSTRALSSVKISDLKTAPDDIKITPLKPHHYEDFETFKQIITNQNIVFTSSWIDKWFGIEKLKKECKFMSQKIEMFESGDREISISEETIKTINKEYLQHK